MTTFGRIQYRRDTTTRWNLVNPILLDGELGLNTTNGLFKLGDGVSTWSALHYFGASSAFAALLVWDAITSKPAVIAAGASAQLAREAIGAVSVEEVDDRFTALVGGADDARDTLKELSDLWDDTDADLADLLTTVNGKQASNANLTALSGLTNTADRLFYFNGTTMVMATLNTKGRNIIGAANNGAIQTEIGLVIGTDVQAHHANLDGIAGLTVGNSKLIYKNSSGNWATDDLTTAGRALTAAATVAAQVSALGLDKVAVRTIVGTSDTPVASDLSKTLECQNALTTTITIQPGVHAANDWFNVDQYGAGQVVFVAGTTGGTMVLHSDGGKQKIGSQYTGVTVRFRSATEAIILGNLVA